MKNLKNLILVGVLLIAGVIDMSTNLLPLLLEQLSAPEWVGTVIRIVAVICTVVKALLTMPPDQAAALLRRENKPSDI